MAETRCVINAMTHPTDWLDRVKEAMASREEIVLLVSPAENLQGDELYRLCQENGYAEPRMASEVEWSELKSRLDLTGLAAKEQAAMQTSALLLQPKTDRS